MKAISLGLVAAAFCLADASTVRAQCSGVLNSECTNPTNPEYNSYRCSQQRACDEKSSGTPWRPTFGAVAYSYATGSFGWQFDDNAEGAVRGALSQCRRVLRQSGAKTDDCKADGTFFRLPGCASIGQSDNGAYFITAALTAVEVSQERRGRLQGPRRDAAVPELAPESAAAGQSTRRTGALHPRELSRHT